MGIALAYDYLEFYHAAVRPLLGRKNFIVCDRYTLCFVAYLKSINSTFPVEAAYANVRRPDLTCYVQVPSHVHDVRLSQRGGRADDEHPDVSLNFHKAYMELLPSYSPRHHLIDNSGTLSHSVETMLAAMHKHFPDDFPLRL
jgi:thymidylate kinase